MRTLASFILGRLIKCKKGPPMHNSLHPCAQSHCHVVSQQRRPPTWLVNAVYSQKHTKQGREKLVRILSASMSEKEEKAMVAIAMPCSSHSTCTNVASNLPVFGSWCIVSVGCSSDVLCLSPRDLFAFICWVCHAALARVPGGLLQYWWPTREMASSEYFLSWCPSKSQEI